MNEILRYAVSLLLPACMSAVLYVLDKKTRLKNLNATAKQLIFGICFSLLAVYCTVNGPRFNGMVVSTRDAVIITSVFLFGPLAGTMTTLTAFFFRLMIPLEPYTRVASAFTALIMGINCLALHKNMFDSKKPSWPYPLGAGIMAELLFLLFIFITRMTEVETAFAIVKLHAYPMILCNGLAALLPIFTITHLSGERVFRRKKGHQISSVFQSWLFLFVAAAMILTLAFNILLQSNIAQSQVSNLLELNLRDVLSDIRDTSDENLLSLTRSIAAEFNEQGRAPNNAILWQLTRRYDVSEISIIKADGVVAASSDRSLVGKVASTYDEHLYPLFDGSKTEFVRNYDLDTLQMDSQKFAATLLHDGTAVQVGLEAERFYGDINHSIILVTKNRHIGRDGSIIVVDENMQPVSYRMDYDGEVMDLTSLPEDLQIGEVFETTVYGMPSYCMVKSTEGYFILGAWPKEEADFQRNFSIYVIFLMEALIFVGLFVRVYFLIKDVVVDNIREINRTLSIITSGNLNVAVNVRDSDEFASLSDDINNTVDTLKAYIAEAAARIDKELEFATTIQHSVLPTNFCTSQNHVELYADMEAAKEVGGDFYDFYFVDADHLVFLIADVSGKGIPAAMFMMQSKALIKGYAESGLDVDEIFTNVNAKLCEGNEAEMFVTAWIAKLNVHTGQLTYANAGHNPPLIRRADGTFAYLKSKPNFILAGMDGLCYRKNDLQLGVGDTLFLYTDGVTEATDSANQLFGEDRLLDTLNGAQEAHPEQLCRDVKHSLDGFVQEAPQFDDITMLCLKYKGGNENA